MPWLREVRGRDGLVHYHLQSRRSGSRALGTDPVAARAALAEARRAEAGPEAVPASDAIDSFVAHLKARSARPGTIDATERRLRSLAAAWAGVDLRHWSRPMLEAYLAGKVWRPRTKEILLTASRTFIAWGRDARVLVPDFVAGLRPPRKEHRETIPLTAEQATALLEVARAEESRIELPLALALLAGLSYHDLQELNWAQVHLGEHRIVRRRAKTGVPLRLPIVPILDEILRRHRATHGPVCRELSKSRRADLTLLQSLFGRARIPDAPAYLNGWHRLRHSCGTLLQHLGVPVAVIGSILGHRPGSVVTLKYLHSSDAEVEKAMSAMETSLQAAKGNTRE